MPFEPTPCTDPEGFKEKLRSLNFTFTGRGGHGTRAEYHELPSKFQQERDHVADMTEAGISFGRK